jgi:uncharacterized protein YcbK (DUF882 family)
MFEVTLVIHSEGETTEVTLDGGLTIGRGDDAELVINDSGLSRVHASIYRDMEAVWIVDENSTNGTQVNGQEVLPEGLTLGHGDEITLGDATTIIVEMRQTPAFVTPAPAPPRAKIRIKEEHLAEIPNTDTASGAQAWWSSPIFIATLSGFVVLTFLTLIVLGVYILRRDDSTGAEQSSWGQPTPVVNLPPTPQPTAVEFEDVSEQIPVTEAVNDSTVTNEQVRQALMQIGQDRGEPMGGEARTEIPPELLHYPDRRRFLAIQTAAAQAARVELPRDYLELARMVREGQFVELQPLGENYVLYGVGGGVNDEPFTFYDRESGEGIPLYRTPEEFQAGLNSMTGSEERRTAIVNFYREERNRNMIHAEFERFANLVRDLGGRAYNLEDAAARRDLKKFLLRHVRQPVRAMIEEIGRAYRSRFQRYLPVTSIIRTIQYQRELSLRNVNAARNAVPPHTTGYAFDISYRYMTAAEQNFLMAEIARLERAGRLEALRENNNSYHIFVFADGRPPPERLIRVGAGGGSSDGGDN